MRVPGRRHWTEEIDLYAVAEVTKGPTTGAETLTLIQPDIQATVQPLTDAEKLEFGLTTSEAVWWARWAEPTPKVGDAVIWRGMRHRVHSLREGHDIDIEAFLVRWQPVVVP